MKITHTHKISIISSNFRNQSAMEYLMTYGWAILIIAVVLGALYSLGVFNMSAYMPKIGPGVCHVFRPNGPGTSWNVALTGSCAGYLPQYVAQFANTLGSGNVQISIKSPSALQNNNGPFTISVWLDSNLWLSTSVQQIVMYNEQPSISGFRFGTVGPAGDIGFWTTQSGGTLSLIISSNFLNSHTWYHVVVVYQNQAGTLYVNGVNVVSGTGNYIGNTQNLIIGPQGGSYSINGSVANVQVYDASLTANQVQYLYQEGIGGAPIYLQHLVGWWPLNGDTNDYSGNNNNGVPTNIAFNGSWTSGYTIP